jgi:two-component system CheB/CheR fusion protein
MPTRSGMAFIIIQHLSPDFKSMMNELLARDTSMKIVVVKDGCRVEPDTIYLMPPKKQMLIADGCLHLSDKDPSRGLMLPIDHFLESLARELGPAAVGIILSGSGTDGTRGIEEISKRGGLVISESLDTAKFDGMPSSAQATGLVDLVLAPAEIGNVLLSYSEDPGSLPKGKMERRERDVSLKGIDAILQMFRNAYDIDFSSYRETTVTRRIRRRLGMLKLETLDQYAEALQKNPDELQALYQDLLIGVTQFFRDGEVFDYLMSTVIPELIQHRRDDEALRIWIAGCATGEEAYSIAIAIQEALRLAGRSLQLKIFATDVHKRSIEHASRGLYSQEVLRELSEEILDRYFTRRTDGFQIRSEIRQLIVYAPHNVLRDAPFTDLDFVSCRNMLIYLQPAAQRRALSLFHYGLRVGGILLLGASESTGELASEFEVLSDGHRVYKKSRDVRLTHNLRSPLTSADALHRRSLSSAIAHRPPPGAIRTRQIHDELLARFMPPSILIDASRTVIDTFCGAEKLLRFPTRQPTLDILDLVDREIRTTLSGAIGRAMTNQVTVRFGKLNFDTDDGVKSFDLSVEPLAGKGDEACYLIAFAPADTAPQPELTEREPLRLSQSGLSSGIESVLEKSLEQIRQLEDDLRYSRENLQATIEELETSNEELQATNEELIASNEELQSTNEELHSLNEELYSVNAEHQRKIEQLAELNRDMNHLLENTDVATVFLDSELRIRRFTSRVREIFEFIDEDVGRSISIFFSKLRIDDLLEKLKEVLASGKPYEREVQSAGGTVYLMRLLPYRPDDRISGVVMMWIDVSTLEILRGRLRWLSAIVESTSDAIIGLDLAGTITSWNRGAEQLYGYMSHEIIGKNITILIPQNRHHELLDYHERILQGETVLSTDTVRLRSDGSEVFVSLTVSPVFNSERQVIGISKIARDIRQRIEMEQKIRSQVQQRERFLATLSHELRNPLNAVRSAAAILTDKRATPQAMASSAASIGRQVGMISHLLADLLDVTRIAENRITLNFSSLDLRELVPFVKEIIQVELDRHKCSIEFELPETPVMVNGDRTRLIQVQVNLIHNAAKYSGTTRPIRVSIEARDSWAHLSVADDGRGIPAEMLESIFEPFAQLDQSRSQSDGGLGIGLTVTKSLITLHGGRILAESSGYGQGTVFHIWLPLAATELIAPPGCPTTATPSATVDPAQAVGPLRICVVEDLEDSRNMIKTLLELDGHQVMAAADGATAIEMLTRDPPDFAIVDIGLPDMSGYDVARQVRKQLVDANLKLIALTGYGQTSDVARAIESGFDLHFVKPIDPAKLQQFCNDLAASKVNSC